MTPSKRRRRAPSAYRAYLPSMADIMIMSFDYPLALTTLDPSMAKRTGTHYVISAQSLDTGAPAYLTAERRWSPCLQDAALVLGEAERDELLALAAKQERLVCD